MNVWADTCGRLWGEFCGKMADRRSAGCKDGACVCNSGEYFCNLRPATDEEIEQFDEEMNDALQADWGI